MFTRSLISLHSADGTFKPGLLAERLVGTAGLFTLEARVFHSVCLIILFGVGLNVPFNLLIGLSEVAGLMLAVFLAAAAVYYMSRFLHWVKTAMAIFLFSSNVVLAVNYFYNSGLNGPTYAIFLLCLLITIAVAPRRQYLVWLPLNFLTMLALFIYDYSHPGWLVQNYNSQASRYTDFLYTYAVIGGLIIFVVINIRKAYHLEQAMASERTTELAAANEVKNKLLSIIAHDLKEPLTSIQGYLELLSDKDLDENQRSGLETALRQRTQNASELLNNVLTWSRAQMEGMQARIVPIQLPQLLEPVLRLMEPLAEEKAVTLISDIPAGSCVLGDPDMLQLVLRNLLTNAIKYSHPGGTVRLSASSADGHCIMTVADQGDGIPPAQQTQLFSLETSSALGTHREKGTGLGLYLCREFMERQGGTIDFTTVANKGTTFTVSLPCCD